MRNLVFDSTWKKDELLPCAAVRTAVWCLHNGAWRGRSLTAYRQGVAEADQVVAVMYRDKNIGRTWLLVDGEDLRALADMSMNEIERQRRVGGVQ